MTRKAIISGNWKMNNMTSETKEFFDQLISDVKDATNKEIIIAPSAPYLAQAAKATEGTNIEICAQNFYPAEKGAYTGEISTTMLKDLGIRTVLIAHSERRAILGESYELIREKVKFAQDQGMKLIFCIGETLEQRESGELYNVIEEQLTTALKDNLTVSSEDFVIAYEPVWAIGTGVVATPDQAQDMHKFIRKYMKENFNREDTRILYGGSVKPGNVVELMAKEDIDGALVGGASLTAESFSQLVNYNK